MAKIEHCSNTKWKLSNAWFNAIVTKNIVCQSFVVYPYAKVSFLVLKESYFIGWSC